MENKIFMNTYNSNGSEGREPGTTICNSEAIWEANKQKVPNIRVSLTLSELFIVK